MGIIYRPDGTTEERKPFKNNKWSLGELQEIVGGYIEVMPGIKPTRLILNEEGSIRSFPINHKATKLVRSLLEGQVLRYDPIIYGTVILLEASEKF